MRQRRWGRPHRGHAWSTHAKRPLELAFQRAFHEEFLVPTARLELAQLSPLPPQDSVSTNFTTSASQKSSAFLESRTFYHAIAASRQFVPARRSPRRCRSRPSRSGNKPLQARRPLASICHVARQYWHPHAHTRDVPGEFPPDIHMKGNSLARMPGRLTMPAMHNRASGP